MNFAGFGFDISHYQGAVDFQQMKAYGAEFVIIRAGQGNYSDKQFTVNKVNSRGVLPRAFYWFYDPVYAPTEQAQACIKTIGGESFSRLWIDCEFWWSGGYTAPGNWRVFRDMLQAAGFKTGIYTSKTWWDDKVTSVQAAEFASDPLWVAQYNTTLTRIPEGWSSPMIWQDSVPSVGYQAGVESAKIDHNLWNTDYNFAAEWGVLPGEPTMTKKCTMLNYTVNVRNRASGAVVAALRVNDVVYGSLALENGREYVYFDRIYRADGTIQQWANSKAVTSDGGSLKYMTVIDGSEPGVEPPPPPPPPPPAEKKITDVTIELASGSIVTTIYSDGSKRVETA